MSESLAIGLALAPVVVTVGVVHFSQYRKGGAYDPTRPEAIVAAYAVAARESARKGGK